MKSSILALAVAGSLGLGGCSAVITQLQQGTTALINFNNALITLNITIIGNMKAQAQQLAPLVCGTISLGKTLAADPAIAGTVNGYLAKHQNGQMVIAVASDLCNIAGLPTTVTAVPATASIPATSPGSGG